MLLMIMAELQDNHYAFVKDSYRKALPRITLPFIGM